MSLFENMTSLSKQHAENSGESGQYHYGSILDNGKIDVVFPPAEPEPSPTVSLYNLLDHSDADLHFLLDCADRRERELRPMKSMVIESYMKAVSWINIIEGALREKRDRDSEAWAEKTAKEN